MPFKSKAQERFMFAKHPKMAKEWADKTDQSKLPEKKMADGGEVQGDQFMQDEKEGFKNGINGDWDALKSALTNGANQIHESYMGAMGDNGTLKGLGDILHGVPAQAAPIDTSDGTFMGEINVGVQPKMAFGGETNPKHETVKSMENNPTAGFADGGDVPSTLGQVGQDIGDAGKAALNFIGQYNPLNMLAQGLSTQTMNKAVNPQGLPPTPPQQPPVDQSFVNQLNAGTAIQPPATPNPVVQASQQAQNIPPTAPSIYQGINANDRAALMQKLLAQKASPGMLGAGAAAGLGDAITSAFGKAPTNALGNLRQSSQQNLENQVGVVDTERQQKMQDMQANMMQQENDPKSPYSNGMRQFVGSFLGKQVPSGVSAAMLKSSFGDIAKIFDSQVQAHSQHEQHQVEAAKDIEGEGFWHKIGREILPDSMSDSENVGANALQNIATDGKAQPAAPSMSGWSVKR